MSKIEIQKFDAKVENLSRQNVSPDKRPLIRCKCADPAVS